MLSHLTYTSKQTLLVSDHIGPYEDYLSVCVPPKEIWNHKLISENMRDSVTLGAWIPVVKKTFNGWYWMDGTKYGKIRYEM